MEKNLKENIYVCVCVCVCMCIAVPLSYLLFLLAFVCFWNFIDVQRYASFHCAAKWKGYVYMHVPFSGFPSRLGRQRAPGRVRCALPWGLGRHPHHPQAPRPVHVSRPLPVHPTPTPSWRPYLPSLRLCTVSALQISSMFWDRKSKLPAFEDVFSKRCTSKSKKQK